MTNQNTNSKKGFTIIEVVLVLAIAGLIFLMVFVAYPALRRSQSDTARRNDISRFISQLSTYKTNNRKLPATTGDLVTFRNQYLDGANFADPDGEEYKVGTAAGGFYGDCGASTLAIGARCTNQPAVGTGFDANAHKLWYIKYASCQGQEAFKSAGKNDIAVVYVMENGILCQSNAE